MSVISEPVARSRTIASVAAAERPRWTALLLISLAQLMSFSTPPLFNARKQGAGR
jgi:hypothetical protein